jgi:curved DNA-binding protein CbpA
MQMDQFVDYYEVMQISPNADSDTLHRVYRILAQRYHPDNQETGDAEEFRLITEAYGTLGDPALRIAYDVKHKTARRLNWKIFDQSNSTQGVDAERRKREGVLSLLYRKRVCQPEQPSMSLRELEELLGVPKEHLEFTIWYLKEGQYAQRADNGRVAITLKGVDLAEELTSKHQGSSKTTDWKGLIAAGRVA